MPLILHKNIENGEIGLWKITEELEELILLAELSTDDLIIYSGISTIFRKKEWLATRTLLNQLNGNKSQIRYHNDGRPFLEYGQTNISISHTKNFVAVMLLTENLPGIDIELKSREVGRVARRFLSPEEYDGCMAQTEYRNRNLLNHWCAKEAVFKMIPFGNIEFSTDILITLNDFKRDYGVFYGLFNQKGDKIPIKLEYMELDEVFMVWGSTEEIMKTG